ncbi:nucleoside deaminase [Kineosporia rhizophila]|uniref:nucleoside deaminase n=1 Tax=Kineosporia TaxID=49184 RepID=UPI000A570D7A|nr:MULTISPECIES: nucleoside deaminase [Kineosporia]MCE0534081.1 nucleoside deaminase [Kineosporia rhizophila]GLY13623.1 hypothetical protein Kisp01_06390 [Kineosporia sp. NBRC 101677]
MSEALDHEVHIRRSIELAHLAVERGDHPFGAVLLSAEGEMIAEGMNAVPSTGDVRAHAELEAVVNARRLGPAEQIPGGIMIASGEPCPMCATGMVWAGLSRIVFAAATPDFAQYLAPGPSFTLRCRDIIESASSKVVLEGPIEGVGALEPFLAFAAR